MKDEAQSPAAAVRDGLISPPDCRGERLQRLKAGRALYEENSDGKKHNVPSGITHSNDENGTCSAGGHQRSGYAVADHSQAGMDDDRRGSIPARCAGIDQHTDTTAGDAAGECAGSRGKSKHRAGGWGVTGGIAPSGKIPFPNFNF